MLAIYVDADACPVKDEVYRVAARYGLHVYVVSNSGMRIPESPAIELVTVRGGFNAADDWIAEHVPADDLVVTDDIPLAERAVKRRAHVLTPRGRRLDEDSICDAIATRNFMQGLRESGEVTSGPAPFANKDRSKFLSALDETIQAARRRIR